MQTYTLCLNNMCIPARLGIFPAEVAAPQTLELDLALEIDAQQCDFNSPEGVPCYATLAADITKLVLDEHTPLCEQLAWKIAKHCFRDQRVIECDVKITKPQAVANARAGIYADFHRSEFDHG